MKNVSYVHHTNTTVGVQPYKTQLVKRIGNKRRFAHEIISYFPNCLGEYHEPFIGSGAVLGDVINQLKIGRTAFYRYFPTDRIR